MLEYTYVGITPHTTKQPMMEQTSDTCQLLHSFLWCISRLIYASCILYIGQTYRYSPEYSFYVFSQQIYIYIYIF